MKKYTAHYQEGNIILVSDTQNEIGRIIETRKWLYYKHYIVLDSKKYDIKM
ncbi:hypothetical protein [Chryseobacterium sp. Mn2064]|uniref:hypothetical protein n=1 Tax=Chryseobacterium sp. Mn2064 TaxID=3395263 RepID=UPI003BE3A79E